MLEWLATGAIIATGIGLGSCYSMACFYLVLKWFTAGEPK